MTNYILHPTSLRWFANLTMMFQSSHIAPWCFQIVLNLHLLFLWTSNPLLNWWVFFFLVNVVQMCLRASISNGDVKRKLSNVYLKAYVPMSNFILLQPISFILFNKPLFRTDQSRLIFMIYDWCITGTRPQNIYLKKKKEIKYFHMSKFTAKKLWYQFT